MGLYQQANNPDKTLEMARAVLKYDPFNPVALLTAAQMLAERTQDTDLDRKDGWPKPMPMHRAHSSMQAISHHPPISPRSSSPPPSPKSAEPPTKSSPPWRSRKWITPPPSRNSTLRRGRERAHRSNSMLRLSVAYIRTAITAPPWMPCKGPSPPHSLVIQIRQFGRAGKVAPGENSSRRREARPAVIP